MLNVYLGACSVNGINEDNIIKYNDVIFDLNFSYVELDNNVIDIIRNLENVEYNGGYYFKSKFTGEPLLLDKLSTGCKVALNVYLFKDKVVDVTECGQNIMDYVLTLEYGNILVTRLFDVPSGCKEVLVHFGDGSSKVCNSKELLNLIFDEFWEE